jgi:benzoyl-CoA reductase/2-hydroxyglutaryl-CoA dehydratase subunit BcrC/BadD/HgdB
MAVLPIHYPKEILTALDILAVEMWGPPGPPRGEAAGRIQSYVCAVVRNALAFLASGGAEVVDGVLFPHTCDSLQGLATQATDLGGWEKAAFVFQHPRGGEKASARRFVLEEFRSLARELEAWTGRSLTPELLAAAILLHDEIDACRASLLDRRARLPITDPELYALLRRGEWLWPEEHLAEVRSAAGRVVPQQVQMGLPLLVTGYAPEPMSLLSTLNDAGAFVAADDYAAIGRRVVRRTGAAEADPWADLCSRHLAYPPCPTRGVDQEIRMRHLVSLSEKCGARGVLVHVQKFCEPELFDVPVILSTFAARGLPVLVLEGELEPSLSGQTETRVEAFVELLRARERAA